MDLNIRTEGNDYLDSVLHVTPYHIVNIGNSSPSAITHFIEAIENATSISAVKKFISLQKEDVTDTCAETYLLNAPTILGCSFV